MIDHKIKKELFGQIGYVPHSSLQWEAHNSTARFRIPCCGRRWGKSTFAANELTAEMFVPDAHYWIVGPNYALGEKEFRVVHHNFVRKLGLGAKIKVSYNVKQGDMRLFIPDWNTTLEVKSADRKDSLVGEGLHGVIMSEAALHDRATWEMYIQPALADHKGWAIFPSTPRGYNWYQGLYELGQGNMDGYQSWRFPSWTNPIVYPGGRTDPEIIRLEQTVSKSYFLQEIGAEFTAFEGQIYEEFNEQIHVTNIEYNPAWRNYWAFDFGFANPFVCLDIMVDPSDNIYVWREYQVRYLSTYEHGVVLKNRENPEGFHVDSMFGDPRGADEIATLTMHLGPIWGRDVPWIQGVEWVKRWLKPNPMTGKPKLFIDRSCTELIRQMKMLRRPNEKEGKEAPEGQHKYDDHGPDALRYFFNELFILGAGSSLSDVYDGAHSRSEAAGFFMQEMGITHKDRFRF